MSIYINILCIVFSTVPGTSKATVEMEKVSWFFKGKCSYHFDIITIFKLRLITELHDEMNYASF